MSVYKIDGADEWGVPQNIVFTTEAKAVSWMNSFMKANQDWFAEEFPNGWKDFHRGGHGKIIELCVNPDGNS